ncbi:sulfatase-like hydrolase/transferase [Olivibacter oleidegradans]|uniref:Sulfatase-like hydrolase/transferase n=1 Tax=Olivibacter oleidegradans TaxID=760123 RepID=A0ABV6HQ45_9SPHI
MKRITLLIVLLCMHVIMLMAQSKKPNILIILADDLGWGDLGYLGGTIKTPVIDQLAKDGIRLNRFYTAAVCSPTRAGLMTGRYPDRFGLRETVIPPWSKFGVNTDETFLPEYLAKAGYKNRAIIGKWHLGHASLKYHPLHRGFTHFYGHLNGAIDYFTHKREGELDWHNDFNSSYDEGYATDLLADEAVKRIRQYSQEENPFFMYLAFNAPHGPFQAKEEGLLKPRGEDDLKKQTYAAMVRSLDGNIGKVLETLKTLNIEDNTIVLFFSDNGYAPDSPGSSGELKGSKFTEWEGGVRAPAIIKWPAKLKGGKTMEQVTGYVDVLPTLLDIAGITEAPENPLDGISIYPVLNGSKSGIQRNFYLGEGALVNSNWKLIEAGNNNSIMKLQTDVLFNISRDIGERKDLKDTETTIYKDLKTKLETYNSIKSSKQVPPYGQGRKGFVAPKEWGVKE